MFKKFAGYLIIIMNLMSCTYSITMVHTEGSASDVVDETASTSPTVSPNISLPLNDVV